MVWEVELDGPVVPRDLVGGNITAEPEESSMLLDVVTVGVTTGFDGLSVSCDGAGCDGPGVCAINALDTWVEACLATSLDGLPVSCDVAGCDGAGVCAVAALGVWVEACLAATLDGLSDPCDRVERDVTAVSVRSLLRCVVAGVTIALDEQATPCDVVGRECAAELDGAPSPCDPTGGNITARVNGLLALCNPTSGLVAGTLNNPNVFDDAALPREPCGGCNGTGL